MTSEICKAVEVYFPRRPYFGLAHTITRVCIADDFLDDCAIAAGCERRLHYRFRYVSHRRFTHISCFFVAIRYVALLHSGSPGNRVYARKWQGGRDSGLRRNTRVCVCMCVSAFISAACPVKRDETEGHSIIRVCFASVSASSIIRLKYAS